jgi:hypothetical protein
VVSFLLAFPCHQGIARPQVADGGDGLQIWRVAANILNKQSRTADKGWSSSLGVGRGANNSSPYKISLLRICSKSLGLHPHGRIMNRAGLLNPLLVPRKRRNPPTKLHGDTRSDVPELNIPGGEPRISKRSMSFSKYGLYKPQKCFQWFCVTFTFGQELASEQCNDHLNISSHSLSRVNKMTTYNFNRKSYST